MAPLTRIPVQPGVLIWARETAGLDVEAAAGRLGVKIERVQEWEAGETVPTIGQVRAMAAAYYRPLAALFMSEPIKNEKLATLPDFRRSEKHDQVLSRALQDGIMRARRQREAVLGIGEELELSTSETDALFSLDFNRNSEDLGVELRKYLEIADLSRTVIANPYELLRRLIRRAENLNVMVMQVQRVEINDMRGFSFGDGPSPIVALNGADWPRGKIFSLLHELAHVGFRSNGLCDLEHRSDEQIERKCDEVAAAALMPQHEFSALVGDLHGSALTTEIAATIGNSFGASGEAAVLRMVELKRATWEDYWRLRPEFQRAYQQFKADERQQSEGKDPPPIFYQLRTRDLGRRFIRQVLDAHGEDLLSTRDVTQLLGVSYDKLPKLARAAGEDF
jgi:Zn-dependent peptidase ImmA (M78 family)